MEQDKKPAEPPTSNQHITRNEIIAAEEESAQMQEPIISRIQELLDNLAGRRVTSGDEGKWTARAVNELARNRGITLSRDERPVYVSWGVRVFEVRSSENGKKDGPTSVTFPKLIAQHTPFQSGRSA